MKKKSIGVIIITILMMLVTIISTLFLSSTVSIGGGDYEWTAIWTGGLNYYYGTSSGKRYGFAVNDVTAAKYNNIYCIENGGVLKSGYAKLSGTNVDACRFYVRGIVKLYNGIAKVKYYGADKWDYHFPEVNEMVDLNPGEHNYILAAILYGDGDWDKGMWLGNGSGQNYTQQQKALYYYWNTWVKESGLDSSYSHSSNPSAGDYNAFMKYKNQATTTNYDVDIYLLKPSNNNDYQDLIVARRYGTTARGVSVPVIKKWEDNNNEAGVRPSSITINLYADNVLYKTHTLTGTGNTWSYTFTGLPKYNDEDKEIKYTIDEVTVPGYLSNREGDATTGYTITNICVQPKVEKITLTNKHDPEKINIPVTKIWEDFDDFAKIRPKSITVKLFANGKQIATKELNAQNEWKYTFENLYKYENGKEINYDIEEVEVKDYETEKTGNKNEGFIITNKHTPYYDGYIEITGTAWLDGQAGKSNNINGFFDKNDSALEGIIVRLKYIDEKGKHQLFNPNLPKVYETKTDAKGEYKIVVNYDNSKNVYKLYEDIKTVNKKLETAYVEFEYDGLKYTTVNDEVKTQKVMNSDGSETTIKVSSSQQSKAIEDENTRNKFDSNHSKVTSQTIHPDNWTDRNITASTKAVTSYEKGKEETKNVVIKYCNGNGTYERTNPNGAWLNIENQKHKEPCENCSGKGHKINTFDVIVQKIPNINLGLFEREQPDVAIFSDLSKVEVEMNKQKYTYLYNIRSNEKNNVGLQVKFQNKDTYTYRRPVNPADIAYIQEANKNAMSVLVTYEVKVANLSNTLPVTIHNIINSYDSEYTLNTKGWTQPEQKNGFKQSKYNGDLNITLNPQQESSTIELTYTVSVDAIRKLLNQEATLNNAVEIESYSTKYGKGTLYAEQRSGGRTGAYAGYDYNSHPGNAGIFINNEDRLAAAKLEDDTDLAPSFVLQKGKLKILSGLVFEDSNIQSDGQRKGDGKQDINNEKRVENVKVEIFGKDGKLAQLYNEDGSKKAQGAAIQWTNSTGYYALSGVVTGEEYFIRYTYGNADSQKVTKIKNGTTVNARNYKSTIITEQLIKDILGAEYPNYDLAWPLKHKDGYSIAVDNMKDRTNIGPLTYNTYNKGQNMTAFTKPFAIPLEFDEKDLESQVTDANGEISISNDLKKFDFGIIERPRENLFIQKTITNIKLTLANGQILLEGNPSAQNPDINYTKVMGFNNITTIQQAKKAAEKSLLMEIDSEIIQEAQLKVDYKINVSNRNEKDYDYGNIENYGDIADGSETEGKFDKHITKNALANYYYFGDNKGLNELKATIEISDYLNKDLVYKQGEKWTEVNANDLYRNGLISEDVKKSINDGYKSVQSIPIQIARDGNEEINMTANKVLTSKEDENVFDNHTEIVKIDGKTGRTLKYVGNSNTSLEYMPGNYIPNLKLAANKSFEVDDDRVKITITPPTGITTYIITYTIIGLVSLITIAIVIIFIKKKEDKRV